MSTRSLYQAEIDRAQFTRNAIRLLYGLDDNAIRRIIREQYGDAICREVLPEGTMVRFPRPAPDENAS
jgi:hypothetical protein